jgi:hypothetical protein
VVGRASFMLKVRVRFGLKIKGSFTVSVRV